MELIEIRKLIITAIASDDLLMDRLVLKGGNALELVHKIGHRASVDIDYSMESEFEDLSDAEHRLASRLKDRFDAAGFIVFDFKFGPRPSTAGSGARWGGYRAEFKIVARTQWDAFGGDLGRARRNAHVS